MFFSWASETDPRNAIAMNAYNQRVVGYRLCHTTTHAALEASQHGAPLTAKVFVVHRLGVTTSYNPTHEHCILCVPQLSAIARGQVFLKPLLLGAVQGQTDELGSSCGGVGGSAASQDRSNQLLEENLSCLLWLCPGEVESLSKTCPRHGLKEKGQGVGVRDDGLDSVVVGKSHGVVVALGVLDQNGKDVV